jgi:hypothetical protein
MSIEQKISQSSIFSEVLLLLKQDITAADRKEAEVKFGYSRGTISQYLNGRVWNNDTAANLITLFKARIAERNYKALGHLVNPEVTSLTNDFDGLGTIKEEETGLSETEILETEKVLA